MPGRVDDIDLDAIIGDGGVLREDRNSAFPFEIVGVQNQLSGGVRIPENVGLLEQPIDQGCLAMVDVGDDGDIANVRLLDRCRFDGHGNGSAPFNAQARRMLHTKNRSAQHRANRRQTRKYTLQKASSLEPLPVSLC